MQCIIEETVNVYIFEFNDFQNQPTKYQIIIECEVISSIVQVY